LWAFKAYAIVAVYWTFWQSYS